MTKQDNDGPASPPEGWQAEVTAETLTDEQILRMQDDIADVTGTNPSYTTIALAHPVGRDRRAKYKRDRDAKRYLAARETCARIWNERYAAINARREGAVAEVVAVVERNPGVSEANVRSNLRSEHGDSSALDLALASGRVVRSGHKLNARREGSK